jgi:alpha-N-arabinofuranosidase
MTTRDGVYKQPIYYPYLHASKYGRGTALNCLIDAPSYNSKEFSDVPVLDSIAVHNQEQATLTIFAVNRGQDEVETNFTLGGFGGYRIIEQLVMTNPDLKAINDMANPNRVQPVRSNGAKIEGERLTAVLPKLSWSVIRLGK